MHRYLWLLLVKPVTVFGLLTANLTLIKFPVLSPGLTLHPAPPSVPTSLQDLYQLRDRLQAESTQPAWTRLVTRLGLGAVPSSPSDRLWVLNHQIHREELAQRLWHQATTAAAAATALGDPAILPEASREQAYTLWTQAIHTLAEVPEESFLAAQVPPQQQQYRQQQAIAAYYYDTDQSDFLASLAEQTGMADQLHITVCTLQRECRRWQGHHSPASPASLIKVPVAVALMATLRQTGVSPSTPILVSPSNWTEDAGKTWVGAEYPLEQIMADMISSSSNIATNQLIDYLGWAGVNQPLRDRGYTATRISTKLVGQSTYPANPGLVPNVITTDEVTDMMVGIYNQEHPGDALIQTALSRQIDLALGHQAVKPPNHWLGEKTGRNSKVLGSTSAVSVGGKTYIITVTLDYSANEAIMRSIIEGIINHLLTHHGFDHTLEQPNYPIPRTKAFLP